MIGEITQEFLSNAEEIHWMINEAGQDVTIRRPGQPDTVTRAFLYQLENNDRKGDVIKPEYQVVAWQGIFKPDAPVMQLPFIVVDSTGREFAPDAPTDDAGTQGVALFAHLLPVKHEPLRAERLKQVFSLQVIRPAPFNPNTGEGDGADEVLFSITQPCSDQPMDSQTKGAISNGVAGLLASSVCYTNYFAWPSVPAGCSLVIRVDGKFRQQLHNNVPDVGGQGWYYRMELGPAQEDR